MSLPTYFIKLDWWFFGCFELISPSERLAPTMKSDFWGTFCSLKKGRERDVREARHCWGKGVKGASEKGMDHWKAAEREEGKIKGGAEQE